MTIESLLKPKIPVEISVYQKENPSGEIKVYVLTPEGYKKYKKGLTI